MNFLKNHHSRLIHSFLLISLNTVLWSCTSQKEPETIEKINRFAVVSRHNVHLDQSDTLGSLSVGNGNFAYTVDITGMQTFPIEYENGIPLGTMSNWGWHTIPSDSNYTREDVGEYFETCKEEPVPYMTQHRGGRAGRATQWLRANPHRLHLGIVGLVLLDSTGNEIALEEIQNPNQTLDLWKGVIESTFNIEGIPVTVKTVGHQNEDQVSFQIESPLLKEDRLKIKFRFPYGMECHTCPGYDWGRPEAHTSQLTHSENNSAEIQRNVDATQYTVSVNWNNSGKLSPVGDHHFELATTDDSETLQCNVLFSHPDKNASVADFETTLGTSEQEWSRFWSSGGAIDMTGSTDPRANELERRIILSQYLTKIQCSGNLPPAETGLTFNSWYGKFHMEMHWWHAVHFALWGRPELLENTMAWYFDHQDYARETAEWQGYEGVRWQKMTGPDGKSSPSSVGEFLVWQQPHFIYLSELLYRNDPSDETLDKYKDLVFETAKFMASFAKKKDDGYYHLCPPLIPAQEHFRATETSDPAFELAYWHWGLQIAQKWRERLGMETDENWQQVIDNLAPIPEAKEYYLPTAEATDAFTNFEKRRDHPIVIGAYGMLPNTRIDTSKMAATYENVMGEWNWETTWGWDYPMLAMTATRLNKPEQAINSLFTDAQKNTYLVNGHNYQDGRLRLYLPGNGGLLTAVAMMAAGYGGSEVENPGFPKNGEWTVKWEGLEPIF